jgi:hypothetical protein
MMEQQRRNKNRYYNRWSVHQSAHIVLCKGVLEGLVILENDATDDGELYQSVTRAFANCLKQLPAPDFL